MARVRVHLVSWNGARYVPFLFASLRAQVFRDWELVILDNGSTDGMVEAMDHELAQGRPYLTPALSFEGEGRVGIQLRGQIIRETKNTGFAPAHNRLIREALDQKSPLPAGEPAYRTGRGKGGGAKHADPDYILLLNQDIYLEPNYLADLVQCMDAHPEAGAATGLLLKWDFLRIEESLQSSKTDVIDSTGLVVHRSRQVTERDAGIKILNLKSEILNLPQEVFGVSGALPMYRVSTIKSIMYESEFFDEDFFSYKEDVDAAYRLRSAGWKAYLVPSARAYHDRSAAGPVKRGWRSVIRNRKDKSSIANYYSYRNHLLTLIKNERLATFLRDAPFILWYELKKAVYLLLFEPRILFRGWCDIFRLLPRMLKKRHAIMSSRSHRALKLL